MSPNQCGRHLVPGSNNALTLVLNVEQYEIMRGPQIDEDVKVKYIFYLNKLEIIVGLQIDVCIN